MQRCQHGVYLPKWAVDGANPYCSCCSNFGQVVGEKEVVLPRTCGTVVYVRVAEDGGDSHRECADCGTSYKVRMTTHQQVKALLAEMEQACSA